MKTTDGATFFARANTAFSLRMPLFKFGRQHLGEQRLAYAGFARKDEPFREARASFAVLVVTGENVDYFCKFLFFGLVARYAVKIKFFHSSILLYCVISIVSMTSRRRKDTDSPGAH